MKKKIIYILCIILIIIGISVVIFKLTNNNLNDNLLKKQVIHNITFSDIKIDKKNNKYIFSVKLTTNKDVEAESFDANFKDKKGNSIEILSGYIGNISSDETKVIEIETEKNINKAYEVSYTVYN